MTRENRRSGDPDFDDLQAFWDDKPERSVSKFDRGIVNALVITLLLALAVGAIWLMIDTAFASPTRPAACADYVGAEAMACAVEVRQ